VTDTAQLRVLLVAGRATGGTRTHLVGLARHLAGAGADVRILASPVTLEPLRATPTPGIALEELPADRQGSPSVLAIRAAVRRHRGEGRVVHSHGLQASLATATAGVGHPTMATWHNAALVTGPRLAAHRSAEQLVARRTDVLLTVSPDLAERAAAAGARDVRQIEVPGPRLQLSTTEPVVIRAGLGIEPDRPVVLTVGRLERQKRVDRLIAAATGWRAPGDPLVLVTGEGSLRPELSARIAASGAPVRLLGARTDVPDLLAAADVAVLASAWEGWPLFAQEALWAGVPLVASDLPGIRALARDGAAYVPAGDPAALQGALERAISDPSLRARLVVAGHRRAAEWLTIDQANEQIHDLMLELTLRFRL